MEEARILEAAADYVLKTETPVDAAKKARWYRKLAMMLVYADANLPKGLP